MEVVFSQERLRNPPVSWLPEAFRAPQWGQPHALLGSAAVMPLAGESPRSWTPTERTQIRRGLANGEKIMSTTRGSAMSGQRGNEIRSLLDFCLQDSNDQDIFRGTESWTPSKLLVRGEEYFWEENSDSLCVLSPCSNPMHLCVRLKVGRGRGRMGR